MSKDFPKIELGHRYAICVGVNDYEYMPKLKYAERDAIDIQNCFLKNRFKKAYLFTDNSPPIDDIDAPFNSSNPTHGKLIWFFQERFEKPFLQANDSIVFYFSGHGVEQQEDYYIMALDSHPRSGSLRLSGISIRYILERLQRSGAGNITLILDANISPDIKKIELSRIHKDVTVLFILSCSPGESSFESVHLEHGLFTYAFIEGLEQGKGFSAHTIKEWLLSRVKEFSSTYNMPLQTPCLEMRSYHSEVKQDRKNSINNSKKYTENLRVDLSRNGLKAEDLSHEIQKIQNWKHVVFLDISFNVITEIPYEISEIAGIQKINIQGNRLTNLPRFIWDFSSLISLDLRGNPLPIPPEILGSKNLQQAPGDLKTILDFYFSIQDLPESDPLYEAKLLIVGEGGAGKTSLAQKLLNPDYELKTDEESTEGIDVLRWEFPHPDGHDFRTNIWDFGGQEIYHATHQFFLTKRSLYLLVADTREQSTDFYYWLKIIELLSDNSPVLIIKNEKQNRQCQINDRALRGEFTNLQEIFAINLADNRGLETLKTAIQQYISRLDHVGTPMPGHWVRIRAVLENYAQTRNYIGLGEYYDLCRQNGFDDKTRMLAVSQYLHDLGICLHFQGVKLLKKTVILKPEWATGAVYKVLDTDTIQTNFGRFSDEDLEEIWSEGDTAEMRDELLALMQEFELCYEIPGCKGRYIAPQLLSKEQPQYNWDDNENLILRYRYDFKPKDILPRFIVAMHEQIEEQCLVWKHGVVLTNGYARAEIIEEDHYHKAEIKIRVSGSNKRHLLSIAAHELEKIQNSYERLQYETLIPCNCQICKGSQNPNTYSWDVLQRFQRDRRDEIQCIKSYEMVNVRGLLDDVIELQIPKAGFGFGYKSEPGQRRSPYSNAPFVIHNHIETHPDKSMNHISQTHSGSGDNVAGDKNINVNNFNQQDLSQAAKEIKSLLDELSDGYDLSSPTGQMMVGAKAVEVIENDPSLKQRVVAALQSAGETALDELIEHPAAKICLAGATGFVTGEA